MVVGPGSPAISGRLPPAIPVVMNWLRSREPVYSTEAPVPSSHGATIARNESCSAPDQEPTTLTLPPSCSNWKPAALGDSAPPLSAGALSAGVLSAGVDAAG